MLLCSGVREEAVNKGVSLEYEDFLLYLATVSGGNAIRNVMIPRLIDSLKKLSPS